MIKLIFYTLSWTISALILIPCLLLSMLSKFQIDYHYEFHMWWFNKFIKNQ